jgi:hypothetical protein
MVLLVVLKGGLLTVKKKRQVLEDISLMRANKKFENSLQKALISNRQLEGKAMPMEIVN